MHLKDFTCQFLAMLFIVIFCKHAEGETSHDLYISLSSMKPINLVLIRPRVSLLPECSSKVNNNPNMQIYAKYLKKIAKKIFTGNSDIFTKEYAPKFWCYSAKYSKLFMAGATNGLIEFEGISNAFTSDAIVAAVMAHELAHVTLQSENWKIIHPGINDPEVFNLQRNLLSILFVQFETKLNVLKQLYQTNFLSKDEISEIQNGIKLYENEVSSINLYLDKPISLESLERVDYDKFDETNFFERMKKKNIPELNILISKYYLVSGDNKPSDIAFELFNTRLRSVLGEPESSVWREMEADLVGLIYYLKAGFDPKYFINQLNTVLLDGEDFAGFQRCSDLSKGPPPMMINIKELENGATHPSKCFRIWRVSLELERLKHNGFKFGHIVNLEGWPNLKTIRAEIKKASE